jgi:hypothetical protein
MNMPIKKNIVSTGGFMVSDKEDKGIDFFYILAGGGGVIGIILIGFIILRYVFHVV